jgi:membrane carboxypeptidase/penicillin-binding protein PbpC
MGIGTWQDTSRFGLALTLGSGEVKMVDMAVAFGTLANYGYKVPLNPFISVTDYTHTTIDTLGCHQTQGTVKANQPGCPGELVVSPGAAFIISDILSDNQARSQAFGSNSVLNIQGHQVAVKTGTTNSLRDNWTIGYTDKYLVAVWVGNNDNSPMSRVASGITGASPIWSRIMTALLVDEPAHRFIKPDTVVEVSVCPLTSTLNCTGCPNARTEYFIQGTEPKNACSPEFIERLLTTPAPDQNRDQILQGAQTTNVYPHLKTGTFA